MRSSHIRRTAILILAAPALLAADEILPPEAGLPIIDWKEAHTYLDREVVVQGTIVDTGKSRTISFLNFDKGRYFTAIVRRRNYGNFPGPVQKLYGGRHVRIRGVISEYRGKPQVEVFKPDQIRILEKLEPPPAAPAPAPRPFFGTLTLATYNVLNLFDAYDDPYHQDEGTDAKPKAELERLARTIREADADVLALQEVENRGYLERFVRAMLPDMGYAHIVCYEGNDRRGIDCAVLSRLPVGPVTSYRHLRFSDGEGGTLRFRRDLIRVRIEPPGYRAFDVFVVHLKSKRGGDASARIRNAEAAAVRAIADDLLRADPDARFFICGDFNDTWESQALRTIRGSGETALITFLDDLPKGTTTYNRGSFRSVIDFILCSPAMGKRYSAGSCRVLPGAVESSGSDHNPVIMRFALRALGAVDG